MSDKKINEVCSTSASQGSAANFFKERRNRRNPKRIGAPFTGQAIEAPISGIAAVYPRKKNKNSNGKGSKPKLAKLESKSEQMLREAIRNLVFLSRIKYHEEQAKIGLQEQKLRKVIRHLLTEADDAQESGLASTGQTAGYSFLKKIEKTTFQNDFQSLRSSEEQRTEFKKVYLTGIKIYLDALDQQYYILNPEERQPNVAAPALPPAQPAGPEATTPNMSEPAARRGDRKINEAAPSPINSTEVNPLSGINTKAMRAQATTAAVQAVGASDKTGHGTAENALNRDLPQIDPLYINLTFKTFSANNANGSTRTTSDRKDFRMMLIGDTATNTAGNIANEFNKIDVSNQTNDSPHKGDASQTPPLTPQPLPTGEPAAPAAPAPTPSAEPPAGPDLAGGENELPV